jgi:glycosyltransferase involved in cell wall biosynthesis
MKILMLLDNQFPPDIRVEKEAGSLVKAGHQVAVLSYMYGKMPAREVFRGVIILRFRIHRQWSKKILGLSLQLPFYRRTWEKAVKRAGKQFPFDIVHIHDLPLCTTINFIKRKFGVPVVADMHENYPFLVAEQPYMNSLFARLFLSKARWFEKEKEWLSGADTIICVAGEMKERIGSMLPGKRDLRVVPNAPSLNEHGSSMRNQSDIAGRLAGNYNILYVGGIDAVRGIDILIRAAGLIAGDIPELRIIIVGDGKSLAGMKKLAGSLGLTGRIIFEGYKHQEEIGSYITLSDVCIIPHKKSVQTDNSSPNKLFQYLFFRKPVISSNCASIEKIIRSEKCGMIYDHASPEELAVAIRYLYDHPAERSEMGNNGYRAVLDRYNWDLTVAPLLSVYSGSNN